jgi:hypothetical protein
MYLQIIPGMHMTSTDTVTSRFPQIIGNAFTEMMIRVTVVEKVQ